MPIFKKLPLLLFLIFLTNSLSASLPITHISPNVVVIGTNSPAISRNIDIDALVQLEIDFATQAAGTISTIIAQKDSEGYILTSALPLSFSTPAVRISGSIPVRSGMITSAILVFTLKTSFIESQEN